MRRGFSTKTYKQWANIFCDICLQTYWKAPLVQIQYCAKILVQPQIVNFFKMIIIFTFFPKLSPPHKIDFYCISKGLHLQFGLKRKPGHVISLQMYQTEDICYGVSNKKKVFYLKFILFSKKKLNILIIV